MTETEGPLTPASLPPSTPRALESALPRAPTLLTGSDSEWDHQVRVWSPEQKATWTPIIFYCLFCQAIRGLILCLPGSWNLTEVTRLLLEAVPVRIIFGLVPAIKTLRRSSYLTTSENGIGVTPLAGPAVALKWDEIASARLDALDKFRHQPTLGTPYRSIRVDRSGYSRRLGRIC